MFLTNPIMQGKKTWLWSGTKISRLVQAATDKFLGVTLTPMLTQHIESDLFSSYLSEVYSMEDLYSPVIQQAQHSRQTFLSHYSWVSLPTNSRLKVASACEA